MTHEEFTRWCQLESNRRSVTWIGQFAHIAGETMHYCEAGHGVPLILLHGLFAWSYTWRHNLSELGAHAHVLAPDFRGFGLSSRDERRGLSLDDQVEVLATFLGAMGAQECVLCGSSMGGEIALRFALRYPHRVKALILSAASSFIVRRERPAERLLRRIPGIASLAARATILNRRFAARTLRSAVHDPAQLTEADLDAYLFPAAMQGSAPALLGLLRDLDFGATADRLRDVHQPALLIWGEQDPWVPLSHGKRLAQTLPQSELLVFPECGHLPHEEMPAVFNDAVLSFLRRQGILFGDP